MKFIALMLVLSSPLCFAEDVKSLVGENASPEYKGCLAEDQCPSQMCPTSCAMMHKSDARKDINQKNSGNTNKGSKADGDV